MVAWSVRLVTLAVVVVASVAAGHLCPCTQGCCEDNWFQYKDACYRPVHSPTSWETAKHNCKQLSAHLASVHSDDEDNFIFHLMGKRDGYWLGAQKTHDRAVPWEWADNSAWDYSKFREPLPQRYHLLLHPHVAVDILEEQGTTYWKYVPDNFPHMYVCKYLLE